MVHTGDFYQPGCLHAAALDLLDGRVPRLVHDPLRVSRHALRLLHVVRQVSANLQYEIMELLLVEAEQGIEPEPPGLLRKVFQLVQKAKDIHGLRPLRNITRGASLSIRTLRGPLRLPDTLFHDGLPVVSVLRDRPFLVSVA